MRAFNPWARLAGAGLVMALAATAWADRVVLKPGRTVDGRHTIEGRIQAQTAAMLYVKTADGKRHKIPTNIVERIERSDPTASPARARPTKRRSPRRPAIPADTQAENAASADVGRHAQVKRIAHYSIIHTADRPALDTAVRVLEKVYQRFFIFFQGKGFTVRQPAHKLVAVLYGSREEYLRHGHRVGIDLSQSGGFYAFEDNTLCLHINTGGPEHRKALADVKAYAKRLDRMRRQLSRCPAGARIVVTDSHGRSQTMGKSAFRKLLKREESGLGAARRRMRASAVNADISTISHEATHQLCFNSGLLSRNVDVPLWLNEGLATFFESARGGQWRGVGKINPDRLSGYHQAKASGRRLPMSQLLTQRTFMADTAEQNLAAYAHVWGLTYFLMHKREAQSISYLKVIRHRQPGRQATPEEELDDFRRAFGQDVGGLETAWRAYMDGLRLD